MSKFLRNKWVHLSAGIVVSAILAVVFCMIPVKKQNKKYNGQIHALNTELASVKSDLTDRTTELNDTKSKLNETSTELKEKSTELDSTKSELEQKSTALNTANEELSALKEDVNAKQAELDKINSEIETVKKDLSASKTELDNAKRGVAHLKQLDPLFTQYDDLSYVLADLRNQYEAALQSGDYSNAGMYAVLYNEKALNLEDLYKNIQKVLEDFRQGNY